MGNLELCGNVQENAATSFSHETRKLAFGFGLKWKKMRENAVNAEYAEFFGNINKYAQKRGSSKFFVKMQENATFLNRKKCPKMWTAWFSPP